MTLAAVLARRGIGTASAALSPLSPPAPSERGQPKTARLLLVPNVPIVPTENDMGTHRSTTARPVLHFRLRDHAPNAWASALGRPGETIHDLTAELRERYGDHLIETKESDQ